MVVGWVGLVINLLMVAGVLVLWMRGLKDVGERGQQSRGNKEPLAISFWYLR